MNNFWQRTFTGVLFVLVLVFCILWNTFTATALFLLFAIVGVHEFYTITRTNKTRLSKYLLFPVAGFIYLIAVSEVAWSAPTYLRALAVPLLLLFPAAELFRKEKRPLNNISYSLFCMVYIVMPFALLNYLPEYSRDPASSRLLLLGFFVSLWANDTGAYITGRLVGRQKLFPRISPNKTWEGFAGGLIFAVAAGYILSFSETTLSPVQWMLFSLLIGLAGTIGDLAESMIKRNYKVKDSGRILPGHGGVLDRFDGVFTACPCALVYLELVTNLR